MEYIKKIDVEGIKSTIKTFIEKHESIDKLFSKAAEATHIDKAFIAIIVLIVAFIVLIFVGLGSLLIDLVGFVFPLYMSIKAIESPDKEDDMQLLTYWLIFGLFKVFESTLGWLVSSIPFYFFIKLAFLVWCQHPKTLGAHKVYCMAIRPYLVPLLVEGYKPPKASSKKENTREVRAMVKSLSLTKDESVYCELRLSENSGHSAVYKTPTYQGSANTHVNYGVTISPIAEEKFSASELLCEVKTEPTFDEGESLGSVRIALGNLTGDGAANVFELSTDKGCKVHLEIFSK